jgi:hypothetical protein
LIGEQGSGLLTPSITILADIFEHRVCTALLLLGCIQPLLQKPVRIS